MRRPRYSPGSPLAEAPAAQDGGESGFSSATQNIMTGSPSKQGCALLSCSAGA